MSAPGYYVVATLCGEDVTLCGPYEREDEARVELAWISAIARADSHARIVLAVAGGAR